MKASWGKARIGVIAIFCAVALAIVGLHRFSGRAYSQSLPPIPTLFVTDACTDAVTAYPAASNGDVSPLAPVPTGLAEPESVAIDANGNIYVTNPCTNTVTIYAKGSNGDAAPIAIIGGSNTGLNAPAGIALDSSGKIYVADYAFTGGDSSGDVFVYPALGSSTGLLNEAPIATISGSNTGLSESSTASRWIPAGNIYVADYGTNTGYHERVCLSGAGKQHRAAQRGPHRHHQREQHRLDRPSTASRWIPAATSMWRMTAPRACSSIRRGKQHRDAQRGPHRHHQREQHRPGLARGIALDSSGNIYVADDGADERVCLSAAGKQHRVLNEAPIATISGSNTDLTDPYGIALDSSGNIYVADDERRQRVCLFGAGKQHRAAQRGPQLCDHQHDHDHRPELPKGIALDSSGNIYVAGNDC